MFEYLKLENLKTKILQPGFKRYFKNTSWMFLGQFFSLAVSFFVGAYIARYLGPENFGAMSYALSFVALFGFLAGFGVENILNRELIKFPEKRDELLSAGFWLKLSGGLLAIIIINLVSWTFNQNYLIRLLIFIFSLTLVGQSFTVINIFFQSQVLAKKAVIIQLVVTLLSAILKLVLIGLNLGVIWLTAVYIFDSLTLALGLLFIYYKNYKTFFYRQLNKRVASLLLRDSWPIMLTAIAVTTYSKIDQIFIKQLLDTTAVGLYSVSARLTEACSFVPSIICASLFPSIVNARDNQANYLARLKKLFLLILLIAIFTALVLFVLAEPIIRLLFGAAYLLSVATFKIYLWSIIPSFLMIVANYYLIAENLTRLYLFITVLGAGLNIILNILLIPHYGILGSALATLISYSAVPLSLLLFPVIRVKINRF